MTFITVKVHFHEMSRIYLAHIIDYYVKYLVLDCMQVYLYHMKTDW